MSELKFEESMIELKKVVEQLGSDDISLDDAIELYKKGVGLSKECKDKLNYAEELIKTVIDESGNKEEFSE